VLTWLVPSLKRCDCAGAAGAAKVACKLIAEGVAGAVGVRPGGGRLAFGAKLVGHIHRQAGGLPGPVLTVPVQPPLTVSAGLHRGWVGQEKQHRVSRRLDGGGRGIMPG